MAIAALQQNLHACCMHEHSDIQVRAGNLVSAEQKREQEETKLLLHTRWLPSLNP